MISAVILSRLPTDSNAGAAHC